MRLVGQRLRSISSSLSEIDRNSQSSSSGGDMDGSSTSEVESSQDERPPVGVPCPASDRVVYERRPDEDENGNGPQVCALSEGTDSNHGARKAKEEEIPVSGGDRLAEVNMEDIRDGRKHELVNTKDDGRNFCAPNGGLLEDTPQTKVFYISAISIFDRAES
jgi:hypothetical protein